MKNPDRDEPQSILLGIGLDGDGHRRVTNGPDFLLVGGSEETHDVMQERAIKIGEELERRGKRLSDIRCADEFRDLADRAGL